ncbi:hypothetical protein IEE94_04670 [Yimella sp. cx-573]|nr:hypothetical protein [Yimella sp. cx-573]
MTTIKAPIKADPDQLRRGVTRRNLTRGVAWAAPTIAFGAHVAEHAVSGYQVWFEPLDIACKTPGASCEKSTTASPARTSTQASVSTTGSGESAWSNG